ncbi:hypothetical protein CAP35_09990 [Chitinophagaceae bacterium IBVUCB1]|nr:hypothetical protein CAP35_09990 [Chitinophagaceae bacterium IBVUCB1]
MQRVRTLLQKIADLSKADDNATLIDIDLMMDYTRVVYADLVELRSRVAFNNNLPNFNIKEREKTAEPTNQIEKKSIRATLEKQIGVNDKYLFISELFGNDTQLYENTIQTLNSFDNYTQAENWLKSKFDWQEEDENAQAFSSLLLRHYS